MVRQAGAAGKVGEGRTAGLTALLLSFLLALWLTAGPAPVGAPAGLDGAAVLESKRADRGPVDRWGDPRVGGSRFRPMDGVAAGADPAPFVPARLALAQEGFRAAPPLPAPDAGVEEAGPHTAAARDPPAAA